MTEANQSPVFSPHASSLETLNFPKAIEQVIQGKKITKIEWGDIAYYGCLHDGKLKLHKPDDIFYPWLLSDGDLSGEDWVVIA